MTSQINLPLNFQQVLDDDEQVLWADKPNSGIFFFSSIFSSLILFLLFGSPFIVIFFVGLLMEPDTCTSGDCSQADLEMFMYIGLVGMIIIAFFVIMGFFFGLLDYWNTFYAFTNKRILTSKGSFGIDFRSVEYDKIIETHVYTDFTKFGNGNVIIETPGVFGGGSTVRNNQVVLKLIKNPYEVFKTLKQYQDKFGKNS